MAAAFLGVGLAAAAEEARAQTEAIAPEYLYLEDLFGEDVPRGETVRSRKREELDPLGVRARSFLVFPSLTNRFVYDDNLFATDGGQNADFIYNLRPNLAVRSDWNNHELTLRAGGDLGFYYDNTDENYEDFSAEIGGRYDISRSALVRGGFGFSREHEERSDPDDVGGAEPTIFRIFDGSVGARRRFNRLSVSVSGGAEHRDYDDVASTGGGVIDNDDRDRTTIRSGVRVGYEVAPGYEAFVRGEGRLVEYDQGLDSAGFDRDSQGYDVAVGAALDLTGLLFGDFFAGYRQRFYDDSRFDTLDGPIIGSALTWIPTGLTTVTLDITSELVESITGGSPGYTSTVFEAGVDHELLRNLILGATAAFRFDDFEQSEVEEKTYSASVSADYLWNRYLTLGAAYRFRYRDSNARNADFRNNVLLLSVTGQL